MKSMVFAKRNFKEMLRDPLCYIFCVALPLAMLSVMHFAFRGNAFWFELETLTPGICNFAYAFVMLYLALLVSQDRSTSFLMRLYTSPMRPVDFLIGYLCPGLVIGVLQAVSCYLVAIVINIIEAGSLTLSLAGILLAILSSLPSLFIYASIGLLFGTLFSNKSAPGLCSAVITVSAFLSGAWMMVDESSVLGKICRALPFYPAVKVGRFALSGGTICTQQFIGETGLEYLYETADFSTCYSNLLIVFAYMLVLFPIAVIAFGKKTRSDNG